MPKGRPGKVKWTVNQDNRIRKEYSVLGPKILAKKMRVPKQSLNNRANYLGIKKFIAFKWTVELLQILKDNYQTEGPTKLSERLNIPYWVLLSKAKRMGIGATRKTPPKDFVWTEDMLTAIKERYVNESAYKLSKEFGVTIDTVRRKAVDLGLRTIAGHAKAGQERAEQSTSCDIHYFDIWSDPMAYILGFTFADGSVVGSSLRYGISSKDEAVLEFIKAELKSSSKITRREPSLDAKLLGRTIKSKTYSLLVVSSTVLINGLRKLGLHPRKTYNDDPFPEIPEDMLPHFIRGFLDGDGCAHVSNVDTCFISFVGSPRFILGLHDSLVKYANVKSKPIYTRHGKTVDYCTVSWSGIDDIKKLHGFVYPKGFSFCYKRKKSKLDNWLSMERVSNNRIPWTVEEEDQLRELYHSIGPTKLAKMLNRDRTTLQDKVRALGLSPIQIKTKWSKEEIEFLKLSYAECGPTVIGRVLGKAKWNVRNKAISLGLSLD